MSQSLLWVTDPWTTLTHSQDTTLRLAHEAVRMRIPTYWSASDFILQSLNSKSLKAISGDDLVAGHLQNTIELPTSEVHQLHYRVDPPVDFNYLNLLEKLEQRVDPGRIFSPPALIRAQSEKIAPQELQDLAPITHWVSSREDAAAAWSRFREHSKIVLKPSHQAQSKGVKLLTPTRNLSDWYIQLQVETLDFKQAIVLQEFLPGIASGEIRMWFANGKFIAALRKYPKEGDFRVLIDEGSKVEAYVLSATEQERAERVGLVLKSQGVKLAAIDWIDGKISDYNITSPGLLVQLEKVHGKNFAQTIITEIL